MMSLPATQFFLYGMFMALLLVGLLTFCPRLFIKMMSRDESFGKGSAPNWILFSEKDMKFLLGWAFRIHILLFGLLTFLYECRYP